MADSDKIEERHKALIGEALRNDACLLEGYAKLWPDRSHQFESKAKEAREIREGLGVEKPDNLQITLYYGFYTAGSPQTQSMWIDNLVIDDEYIGPMNGRPCIFSGSVK